ncbi:MAG TPA: ATP-binding cassette domain-containing protein [Candidatus Limnocylindrales bacterium]|nr:ATP-binding cassette domain-containing protein [Candidatus Limnocylindrales bacterium]
MLLSVAIHEKSFGTKVLYRDLAFSIEQGEKVGLIGGNGTGKSTLFDIIAGQDHDYDGEVILKRGAILVSSRQEHHGFEGITVLEYLQGDLPEYKKLARIIDAYPATMGADTRKLQIYSDALERFGQLGYYQLEDELDQAFERYQIDPATMHRTLGQLSGGQRRMVELIKVQRSRGHLALIDEPTNHMDFVAKETFIKWLKAASEAIVVVTHDRDVLRSVDRILELRDGEMLSFKGNYDDYLRSNTQQVSSQVNEYDITQRRIKKLEEDVIRFKRLKERSRDPGTIRRFKSQEQWARDELAQLEALQKPSFWIDKESVASLPTKLASSYDTHKARTIRIKARSAGGGTHRQLIDVQEMSLGYERQPLFKDISFRLHEGERLRLHGRNGAGKTTLVQAVLAQADKKPLTSKCFKGSISLDRQLAIGVYDQELDPSLLGMSLEDAIARMLDAKGLPVSQQQVKQLLGDYLFNPASDGALTMERLSGGQKARFQLMRMLAAEPSLLILDEPTNHLDLPSIEELESALRRYEGAIIYISHDSYFAKALGGNEISIP